MSQPRIPLSEPCLGGNEARYLQECVSTNFVSSVGPFVERFEHEMAEFVGAAHAVACSSGTAAIHLALVAAGVEPGDEVFVSDLTFIASANPARYCGARVTLIDSEAQTWNLDPALVVDEIDRRARRGQAQPAAVVAVHLLGHPARLETLLKACREHDIALVEDAAEALGAVWLEGSLAGAQAGTIGDLGCFSFNGNKVMTTGGGGMVVTADEQQALRIRHLSTQARIPGPSYEHDSIGFNYRLTNIGAAVGTAQLEQLPAFLDRKREIAARYDRAFSGLPGTMLPPDEGWARRSSWLYSLLLPSREARERVRTMLLADGIEARPIWSPIRGQAPYAATPVLGGEVAVDLAHRALSLPSSVGLTEDQQEEVIGAVRRAAATT